MSPAQSLIPVTPGSTIGILGSGQLGRMLAQAAAQLGLKTHIYAPDRGPAFDVSTFCTLGSYEDEAALATFAESVAVVTYEFENVPAGAAAILNAHRPVLPAPDALAITQDRLSEKNFLNGLGIAIAPFRAVDDVGGLARALNELGAPAILKTRRFGYDGKGQAMLREGADLPAAFASLGGLPAVLEAVVPFAREVSVVAARAGDGSFSAFDVCENQHENHILSLTRAPARIGADTATAAVAMTRKIMDALKYVGVIAVEMFVVEEGEGASLRERLVINEIAPRVHNSGHWTQDGAVTSQFEQHVRAICGWPLGSTRRHGQIEMRNLIGDEVHRWRDLLGESGACVRLYGKHEARPGRKMGHVTQIIGP